MRKKVTLKLNEVVNDKEYFRGQLAQVLKSEKLPCSKPTFLKLERLGVIEKPIKFLPLGPYQYRIYSGEQIKNIVIRVREYYAKR